MLTVYGVPLQNRLWLGTAQYPSLAVMCEAIQAAAVEVITVSLKRQTAMSPLHGQDFWHTIQTLNCRILPNTAGCRTAREAVMMAEMSAELCETQWIKLEVIGDEYTLQPDPFALVEAAKTLVEKGFHVFPYCTDDLIVCQRLVDVGCRVLMPWAAPIGSGRGPLNPYALHTLRARLPDIPLLVDAGIGKPQHATAVMEWGFDGVLLNTAVSMAEDPIKMATAFSLAVKAGRLGYEAGTIPERNMASPSTPLWDTPFWHVS